MYSTSAPWPRPSATPSSFQRFAAPQPALWRLLPAHIELLLLGWTLNLALGMAYWILPRYKTGAPRGATRTRAPPD